jgi:hypothetical protein
MCPAVQMRSLYWTKWNSPCNFTVDLMYSYSYCIQYKSIAWFGSWNCGKPATDIDGHASPPKSLNYKSLISVACFISVWLWSYIPHQFRTHSNAFYHIMASKLYGSFSLLVGVVTDDWNMRDECMSELILLYVARTPIIARLRKITEYWMWRRRKLSFHLTNLENLYKEFFGNYDDGDVDWTGLAQDRNSRRALVNSVLDLRVPWNAGKLASGLTSSGLSSSAQFHS